MPTVEHDALSHWSTLIDALDYSTNEFSGALEAAFDARQIPKVKTSRIDFSEGGMLPAKRLASLPELRDAFEEQAPENPEAWGRHARQFALWGS